MARPERTLVTIPISHFCEKARWALDRAGIEYTERRNIQIIHQLAAKRARGGKTVPVLTTPEGVFGQSRGILVYADLQLPEPQRLYPGDDALCGEVLALEARFDSILGVEGRRWLYHEVFKDPKPLTPFNLTGVPGWERRIFPFVLQPAKVYINRSLDIDEATVAQALRRVDKELDFVGELLSDGRRYLVGDRFTAADLAFAALSAPLTVPLQYGTPLPQPEDLPERMAERVRAWRAHPAGQFALRMFAEHRATVVIAPAPAA